MRSRSALLFLATLLAAAAPTSPRGGGGTTSMAAQDSAASLPAADRVRLAEAFALAAAVGDRVWPAWSRAPFAVLLVTPEHEFLLRHPRPSTDFRRIGYDGLLGSEVHTRRRIFPTGLLATFPAVGGVPTIVIGQPASTGLTSTRWVLTVLHEHFHQLQYAQPGYHSGVAALDLARGDTTGMWMLNFAFPYDTVAVQLGFADFTRALAAALEPQAPSAATDASGGRLPRARVVAAARRRLGAVLPAADDRYLAFQMWQEGGARYTELRVARLAAEAGYVPGGAFRALADYTAYAAAAAAIERGIRTELRTAALGSARRVAFYPAGAATALVLDVAAPGWQASYFARPFALEPLLP